MEDLINEKINEKVKEILKKKQISYSDYMILTNERGRIEQKRHNEDFRKRMELLNTSAISF